MVAHVVFNVCLKSSLRLPIDRLKQSLFLLLKPVILRRFRLMEGKSVIGTVR